MRAHLCPKLFPHPSHIKFFSPVFVNVKTKLCIISSSNLGLYLDTGLELLNNTWWVVGLFGYSV
jgi:hypothetical protein